MSKQPVSPIHEIREYVDLSTGGQVTQMTPVSFAGGDVMVFGKSRFRGMIVLEQMAPSGQRMSGRFPFMFPEDYSLKDCWDNFEKVAQEELKKAQEEERHRIVVPGK